MLCIQEDVPDIKYMSGKNKYGQFLAATKQLPLDEFKTVLQGPLLNFIKTLLELTLGGMHVLIYNRSKSRQHRENNQHPGLEL